MLLAGPVQDEDAPDRFSALAFLSNPEVSGLLVELRADGEKCRNTARAGDPLRIRSRHRFDVLFYSLEAHE